MTPRRSGTAAEFENELRGIMPREFSGAIGGLPKAHMFSVRGPCRTIFKYDFRYLHLDYGNSKGCLPLLHEALDSHVHFVRDSHSRLLARSQQHCTCSPSILVLEDSVSRLIEFVEIEIDLQV